MYKDQLQNYNASQNKIELNKLFMKVAELNPKNIMVLGIENNELIRFIRETFHPEILIGVDSHEKQIDQQNASYIFGNPVDQETFDQVVDKLVSKQVDFLFLNHDKTFDGLKSEYFLYRDLVRPGGIIAMDSIRLKSPAFHMAGIDVADFWSSLTKDNRIEYFEFWDVSPNGYGPGIGMMYKI